MRWRSHRCILHDWRSRDLAHPGSGSDNADKASQLVEFDGRRRALRVQYAKQGLVVAAHAGGRQPEARADLRILATGSHEYPAWERARRRRRRAPRGRGVAVD